jgi:NDP-sugar pyrophosphorylase family protein
MVELHRRLDAQVTVALARYRSSWGVVKLDGEKITGFVQSPELPYWINAGVYLLDPATIELLPERGDHEDTTFPELAAEGRLAGYRIDGYWRGIDTLKDVNAATRELQEP